MVSTLSRPTDLCVGRGRYRRWTPYTVPEFMWEFGGLDKVAIDINQMTASTAFVRYDCDDPECTECPHVGK